MSLLAILETIFIGPLKLVFEIIFSLAHSFVGHPGLAIIFLSLIMNILVLPLYKRADAMQEAARDIDLKLSKGVAHIKKTFSGDEQMMILQTYYRQNNYKPTDALKGSVSLLLEIPFFMAAYQFLSNLDILNGVSFGPIADMGAPDGLIVIGGITINLLPVLMTLINVISSAIYLKGFPLKTKIQLYGMAAFFLVFLYTSPSCLVFYWTLNNLFSLVKTIFYKLKNPKKVLYWLMTIVGVAMVAAAFLVYGGASFKVRFLLVALGCALILPQISTMINLSRFFPARTSSPAPNKGLFVLGSIFLTLLVGLLIPSTYIAASPQEYVDITYFQHPLWYIVSTTALAAGTFMVWLRVFYWLANDRWKVVFERLVWVLCGLMLVNYIFFGTNLGIISSTLQYENGLTYSRMDQLINLVVLALVAGVMYFIAVRFSKVLTTVLLTASLAVAAMSGMHIVTINDSINHLDTDYSASGIPTFQMSTEGENVVVLMLDRALAEYVPFIFQEKPELNKQFEGFTFYRNTISYGIATNMCTPALFGGYEYTPVELNRRSTESLMAKHNEAIQVLPRLFLENGYDVSVCDPVYVNYQYATDLSLFDQYPEINAFIAEGRFDNLLSKEQVVANRHRNFFCFSMMKCAPVIFQSTIYNGGNYNQADTHKEDLPTTQTATGLSTATGQNALFTKAYNVLDNMDLMTHITSGDTNTFLVMVNNTTHEPMLLQAPDYVPSSAVDNTLYDAEHAGRFSLEGQTLEITSDLQMAHYHANMAALLRLGEWFDYLRENNVYDNTRIIIAADHGRELWQTVELRNDAEYLGNYYPMLLVKDFNSNAAFTTSNEFMTIADIPSITMEGLIENPVNPFTGKAINNDEKFAHEQFITRSIEFDIAINNGNTFLPSKWASVKDDLWDHSNWTFYDEETVLAEHAAP